MKRKAAWWIGAAIVLLLVSAALGRGLLARKAEQGRMLARPADVALELAPLDVAVVRPRELLRTLEITGAIKAVNSAIVKAKVAGEVQQLTVRAGDRVTTGQVLGRIDATEYAWKLRQAQEQSAQAGAQLDIAERALENNRALVNQCRTRPLHGPRCSRLTPPRNWRARPRTTRCCARRSPAMCLSERCSPASACRSMRS